MEPKIDFIIGMDSNMTGHELDRLNDILKRAGVHAMPIAGARFAIDLRDPQPIDIDPEPLIEPPEPGTR
ncbi:MAG: hypothetical protein GY773_15450 [Actinomycetia bacterium]|nr:hypothetical protein [Actinomycetes bacterium]